jgi:pyruvate formate lyase activating enzyme
MKAISLSASGDGFGLKIDRKKCNDCGTCVDTCSAGAIRFYGQIMTVDEVFDEIKKDMGYYSKSQGGVTASGGEPLLQPDFVTELFGRCRKMGIHTALETCGYSKPSSLYKVLDQTDLVLLDIKLMDRQRHKQFTGMYNGVILRNARSIVKKGVPMMIRMPLIPTANDTENNINDTARFISELDATLRVELLPYHNYGEKKYEMLDMKYQLPDVRRPDEERLNKCQEIFSRYGIESAVR